MPIQEVSHRGKRIIINVEGDQVRLTINGEMIPVMYDSNSGRCVATKHLPYASYSSLVDLAKGVIDNVIIKRPH